MTTHTVPTPQFTWQLYRDVKVTFKDTELTAGEVSLHPKPGATQTHVEFKRVVGQPDEIEEFISLFCTPEPSTETLLIEADDDIPEIGGLSVCSVTAEDARGMIRHSRRGATLRRICFVSTTDLRDWFGLMHMATFTPGNIVTLKSGGPLMTVQAFGEGDDPNVDCSWFDGDQYHEEAFHERALILHSYAGSFMLSPETNLRVWVPANGYKQSLELSLWTWVPPESGQPTTT